MLLQRLGRGGCKFKFLESASIKEMSGSFLLFLGRLLGKRRRLISKTQHLLTSFAWSFLQGRGFTVKELGILVYLQQNI